MFEIGEPQTTSQVVVGGRALEVATFAPPQPPSAQSRAPIVMLHEGLGSLALWKTFPLDLAVRTGRRVVAYSRYGYGDSDVLAEARGVDYMHWEGEVVLPGLLAALGIERPVLYGHSDGASIALIYAGRFPGAAEALVLEAPHAFVEDRSIEGIARARDAYRATNMAEKLARYHRDAERTFWGWNDIWLDPRFRAWNIESYVRAVDCPVLVVQGHDDEYGTKAQVEAIAEAVPDTTVAMLDGCGHWPHRDRTEGTLSATAAFLERHVRRAPR